MANKWVRVTRREPCPICAKTDYCTRSGDGQAVHCMRIESAKECPKGGWIHRLADPLPEIKFERRKEQQPTPDIDWNARAEQMYRVKGAQERRELLSAKLGVSVSALELLKVGSGWDEFRGVWFHSFPERDSLGRVTGIIRRYDDGTKKGMQHGRHGLYFRDGWSDATGPTLIVEGGSDTAALLDLGLCVVGRPSNIGGVNLLASMLQRKEERPVLVIGENDRKHDRVGTKPTCPKKCPGCSWCWPGRYGCVATAERLSRAMRREVFYRLPPKYVKDVREWMRCGEFAHRVQFIEALKVPKKWIELAK